RPDGSSHSRTDACCASRRTMSRRTDGRSSPSRSRASTTASTRKLQRWITPRWRPPTTDGTSTRCTTSTRIDWRPDDGWPAWTARGILWTAESLAPRRPLWSRRDMRILLTGSREYIGSVMAPLLSAAGHEVVGLDTDFYRTC